MLRIVITLLVCGVTGLAALAQPTYLLVDHSGSMSNGEKQNRVETVIEYYANDPSVPELSLTYFGGSNGGNCAEDVKIEPLISTRQVAAPNFPADLNAPLLSALDGVVKQVGTTQAKVVVVTDGDDACNSAQSICMAVNGYREHHPNLSIEFEGVNPEAVGRDFLRCVAEERPSKSVRFPGVAIAMQTIEAERLPAFHMGILHFLYLSSIPFLLFARFVWQKVRRTTSLISKLEQSRKSSTQGGENTEHKPSRVETLRRNWIEIAFYFILIIVGFIWTLAAREHVPDWWQESFAYLNTRLGAAIATVAFGSLLGFLMLAIWKNSLQQLENQFIEASNLEATQARQAYLTRFKTSYDEFLASLTEPDPEDQEEFNTWRSHLDLFFQDLSIKIQSKAEDVSWNPSGLQDLSFDLKSQRKFRSRLAALRLQSEYDYFIDEIWKYK